MDELRPEHFEEDAGRGRRSGHCRSTRTSSTGSPPTATSRSPSPSRRAAPVSSRAATSPRASASRGVRRRGRGVGRHGPTPSLVSVEEDAARNSAGSAGGAAATRSRAPPSERKDKRAKKLVGLKIGASQIAAAQVVNNGAPELVEVFREPLEPGVVVSGEIRDPETLGDALKRFFELHKLPKRGVRARRLQQPHRRADLRDRRRRGSAQLENAIRFRAEEVLPIPLDQAVLDYVVLDERGARRRDASAKRILLVVAYREVVDRYLQACRRAGLQVVGIDLEAFALLRSLEPPTEREVSAGRARRCRDRPRPDDDRGLDRASLRVRTRPRLGRLVAQRRDRPRARPRTERGRVDQAPALVCTARPTSTDSRRSRSRRRATASSAHSRPSRASSSPRCSSTRLSPVRSASERSCSTGGTAHMDGLPDAVGELVGVPVRLGDPFRRVKVGPNVTDDAQHRLARDRHRARDRGLMRAVNLLPRDLERQGSRRPRTRSPLRRRRRDRRRHRGRRRLFISASGHGLGSALAARLRRGGDRPGTPAPDQPAVALGADRAGADGSRRGALRRALDARPARPPPPRARLRAARGRRGSPGSPPAAPTERRRPRHGGAGSASTTAQGVTIQGATYSQRSVARVLARLHAHPVARPGPSHGDAAGRARSRAIRALNDVKPKNKKKQRTVVTFTIAANLAQGARREAAVRALSRACADRHRDRRGAVYLCALWFLLVAPKRSEAASSPRTSVAARSSARRSHSSKQRRPQRRGVHGLRRPPPREGDAVERRPGRARPRARPPRASSQRHARVDHAQEAVVGAGGATTIPVVVTVERLVPAITRFLARTRGLVRACAAGGARDRSTLHGAEPSSSPSRSTKASRSSTPTILLNAYVYDGPIAPAIVTPPASDGHRRILYRSHGRRSTP